MSSTNKNVIPSNKTKISWLLPWKHLYQYNTAYNPLHGEDKVTLYPSYFCQRKHNKTNKKPYRHEFVSLTSQVMICFQLLTTRGNILACIKFWPKTCTLTFIYQLKYGLHALVIQSSCFPPPLPTSKKNIFFC